MIGPLPPLVPPQRPAEERAVMQRVIDAARRARERFRRELDALQASVQPLVAKGDEDAPDDTGRSGR